MSGKLGDTCSRHQVHSGGAERPVLIPCYFFASLEFFTCPALGTWWNFLPGNVMAFTPCFSVFLPIREMPLNGFVGRWGVCATQREGRTLCLKPIWSHWANSSTCLQCWTSWRTWSAVWRTTTQPTSGECGGQQDPAFAARIQASHEMAAVAFLLTAFSSKIVSSRVGQATLKLGMAWLQLGSWMHLFSLCSSSSSKGFSAFNAKLSNTSVLVYAKCNAYTLFSKVSVFKHERKLAFWSLVLLLFWSILFLAPTFDVCSWELLYLFLRCFIFAVQSHCDCRYNREGRGWDTCGQTLCMSYQMVSGIFCWTQTSEQQGKTALCQL